MIIPAEKIAQSNVDDFLAHHGVLGMKWGHHRSEGGDSGGGSSAPRVKKVKPTTADIKNARLRNDSRQRVLNDQVDKYNTAVDDRGRAKAEAAIERITKEGAADAKLATKSTRGEKIALGVLAGVVGAHIALGVAASASTHPLR